MSRRRAPLAPVFPLLFLGGCGLLRPAPALERVSLDLDAVARRTAPRPLAARTESPAPPPPLPAAATTLPPLPAIRPEGPRGARVENVRARLAREAALAEARLAARLREVYAAEIEALRFEGERETAELRRAGAERALAAIRSRFERLASARAPLVARLSFLEGFPDPGPGSGPIETEAAKAREVEANDLRAKIAALDAAFDRDVAAVVAEGESAVAERAKRLAAELVARRRELDARAATEAAAQVKGLTEDLDLTLAGRPAPLLPPVAALRARVPASAPLPRLPAQRVDSSAEAAAARRAWRERLGREAEVWAGLAGAVIVPRAAGVRDATADFERWRKDL